MARQPAFLQSDKNVRGAARLSDKLLRFNVSKFVNEQQFHGVLLRTTAHATLFVNEQTFHQHRIDAGEVLTATKFVNAQAFHAHKVAMEYAATSFANASVFHDHELLLSEAGDEGTLLPVELAPINEGLVFCVGSHPEGSSHLGKELVNDAAGTLLANGNLTAVNENHGSWLCLGSTSTADGGAHWALPAGVQAIAKLRTMAFHGRVDATIGNSKMIGVPYRATGWDAPFRAASLARSGWSSNLSAGFTTGSGQSQSATSEGGFTTGEHWYVVTLDGVAGEARFYLDGSQVGPVISISTADMDWGEDRPICIMQRSSTATGEGVTGRCYTAAVWDRVLSASEVASLASNPRQMFFTDDDDEPDPGLPVVNVDTSTSTTFINGIGENTLIQYATGTYTLGTIIPKAGQVHRGNPGNPAAVVLDGQGQNKRAFNGNVPNVTLNGLTITRYASGAGSAMVVQPLGAGTPGTFGAAAYATPAIAANHSIFITGGGTDGPAINWTLRNLRIHENYCTGTTCGPGWRISNCEIWRNGHKGIGGRGSSWIIEDCHIHDNGLFQAAETEDVAGIKITGGNSDGGNNIPGGKIRRCQINDNWGDGIWLDFDVPDTEIHNCSIYRNTINGIRFECAARCFVHHNQIGDNQQRATEKFETFMKSEVSWQNSKLIRFEDNVVVSKRRRMMFIGQENRSESMPQSGKRIGHFTASRNRIQNNLFLAYHSGATCFAVFSTHACSNNNPNCGSAGEVVGHCTTVGSGGWGFPPRSPHIADTTTAWHGLALDEWCFLPNPGQSKLNVISDNTWKHVGASLARFNSTSNGTVETNATIHANQSSEQLDAHLPNWTVLPSATPTGTVFGAVID